MVRVGGMPAHPARERHVVYDQRRIVATRYQPGRLGVCIDIKQTDRDRVKPISRRSGQHLTRRDRVPGQQEVPTVPLQFKRMAHHRLGGPADATRASGSMARAPHRAARRTRRRARARPRPTAGRSTCLRHWHR